MAIFRPYVRIACIVIITSPLAGQELRRSGFLGVSAAPLSDAVRQQLAPNESGIVVQNVVDGGTAKDAGIQANDIITQVNDHKVVDVADFVQIVRTLHSGDTATIHLRRGAETLTKQLPVKPRPYESAPDVDTQYKAVSVDGSLRRVIVTVPTTSGKHPAVLYIDGMDASRRKARTFRVTTRNYFTV